LVFEKLFGLGRACPDSRFGVLVASVQRVFSGLDGVPTLPCRNFNVLGSGATGVGHKWCASQSAAKKPVQNRARAREPCHNPGAICGRTVRSTAKHTSVCPCACDHAHSRHLRDLFGVHGADERPVMNFL
jgi:hypothetical protein